MVHAVDKTYDGVSALEYIEVLMSIYSIGTAHMCELYSLFAGERPLTDASQKIKLETLEAMPSGGRAPLGPLDEEGTLRGNPIRRVMFREPTVAPAPVEVDMAQFFTSTNAANINSAWESLTNTDTSPIADREEDI